MPLAKEPWKETSRPKTWKPCPHEFAAAGGLEQQEVAQRLDCMFKPVPPLPLGPDPPKADPKAAKRPLFFAQNWGCPKVSGTVSSGLRWIAKAGHPKKTGVSCHHLHGSYALKAAPCLAVVRLSCLLASGGTMNGCLWPVTRRSAWIALHKSHQIASNIC